jgi:hypothetical protein
VAARGPRLPRVSWLLTGDARLAVDLLQTVLAKVAERAPDRGRQSGGIRAQGAGRHVRVLVVAAGRGAAQRAAGRDGGQPADARPDGRPPGRPPARTAARPAAEEFCVAACDLAGRGDGLVVLRLIVGKNAPTNADGSRPASTALDPSCRAAGGTEEYAGWRPAGRTGADGLLYTVAWLRQPSDAIQRQVLSVLSIATFRTAPVFPVIPLSLPVPGVRQGRSGRWGWAGCRPAAVRSPGRPGSPSAGCRAVAAGSGTTGGSAR